MYKVYLDDEFIYGVTSFEDESGRDISIYDGVGQGNFPVPESQDLHKWSLECELSEVNDMNHKEWKKASEIFEHMEKILGQKESVRLVVTSAYTNLSELVFLEKYSKSEKVNGIFDVQMSFVQYKAVSARTEDVPYVERPGKIPVPPKAVVNNPYKTEKKYTGKTPVAGKEALSYVDAGANVVKSAVDNPNLVPKNVGLLSTSTGLIALDKANSWLNKRFEYDPIGDLGKEASSKIDQARKDYRTSQVFKAMSTAKEDAKIKVKFKK